MIDQTQPKPARKKTPEEASEFEREQLRFFLSGDDLAATLATVNPSLAWLPVLSEMKLLENDTQLIAWVERNFSDVDAVRDVVNNLPFFGPQAANFLEFRLNGQSGNLSPLLAKSWQLIIRHMRTAKRGLAQNEWFEIAPQLKRGEHSAELLERLAHALRPKLKLSKRLSWYDREDKTPERPSDLMSIDFEVDDGVPSSDVLAAWPEAASADVDEALLLQLTTALSATLADATDVGVEGDEGFSTSDTDVPSVARHAQNEYRSGFQTIVRVIAEVWTRLATKSPAKAVAMAERWRDSQFRLIRRLALFAAVNPVVPADVAASMLARLPPGELFLSSSSVEINRLISARWKEFPKTKQNVILGRFRDGPPQSLFREGADIDRAVDHCRYEILSSMARDGLDIGAAGKKLLADIGARYPQWRPKPVEQAGFHVWHESGFRDVAGDMDKLKNVPDNRLVAEATKIAAKAAFMDGDLWQGLCLSNPDRALRGLDYAATDGDLPVGLWEQLLWSRTKYSDSSTEPRIAQLLLQWPAETFSKVSAAASSWLNDRVKTLSDDLLWPLWDKIADASLIETDEAGTEEAEDA
jgi:hypothetical protein